MIGEWTVDIIKVIGEWTFNQSSDGDQEEQDRELHKGGGDSASLQLIYTSRIHVTYFGNF